MVYFALLSLTSLRLVAGFGYHLQIDTGFVEDSAAWTPTKDGWV